MKERMHDVQSRFSQSRAKQKREKEMNHILIKPVSVNGNGTSGYMLKNGPNRGKTLKHLKVKHHNSF